MDHVFLSSGDAGNASACSLLAGGENPQSSEDKDLGKFWCDRTRRDLSLESRLVRDNHPHCGPYFRLVNYSNLPRFRWMRQISVHIRSLAQSCNCSMRIMWFHFFPKVYDCIILYTYPLVIRHGWLENIPFTDDFPILMPIYWGLPIAVFDYLRYLLCWNSRNETASLRRCKDASGTCFVFPYIGNNHPNSL